jgi:hypothetical protein
MSRKLTTQGYNFRFSERQWLEYGQFLDVVYRRRRVFLRDLVKTVLIRSVFVSQIEHGRALSVASMAASLDLPNETVRRKCLQLAKDGWLARGKDGYMLGRKVDASVFGMVEENIERMLRAAVRIDGASRSASARRGGRAH